MVYISLQQASKLCPYSQEYLSLRARQGKLKAVKLGRNWVCTKEWLQEYIANSGNYKKRGARMIDPPRNLPIYAPDAEMWEDEIPADIERQRAFQRKFQFAFAVVLVAALSLASLFQGREQFFPIAEKVREEVISFAASFEDTAQKKGFVVGKGVQVFFGAVSLAVVRQPADESWSEVAKEYFAWLSEQVRNISSKGY